MSILAISIDLPPVGALEISGDGSSPTPAQIAEEEKARQKFLDTISPFLASLPKRPPHRFGNVSNVDLQGAGVWSELNHYLLLLTVDLGNRGIDQELLAILPQGTKVSVIGIFGSLQTWPEAAAA